MPKRSAGALGGRVQELEHIITVRLSDRDVSRLAELRDRLPVLTQTTLARIAMRLGLDAIEKNPALALLQPVEKRGGARRKRGK